MVSGGAQCAVCGSNGMIAQDFVEYANTYAIGRGEDVVICPKCGCVNTHLHGVAEEKTEYASAYGYRSGHIEIAFTCERGHAWDLVLGEHKGDVFVSCRNMRTVEPHYDGRDYPFLKSTNHD